MDAEQLLEQARAGNASTLGRLLESHRNYLRLLARVEIGPQLQGKVDASDVVQETLLAAHGHFASFRGRAGPQFTQWLREILAGTLANVVRCYLGTKARDVRRECALATGLDPSSHAVARIPADPHSSPSQHTVREEQTFLVAEALSRLPEHYQR